MSVVRTLKPDEVGCYNCVRWRTGSESCPICSGFSQFKSVESLNAELKFKGLEYLCCKSIEDFRSRTILKNVKSYQECKQIYDNF